MERDRLVFTDLLKAQPVAAELLRMCLVLAPEDIPEELFRQGASALGSHLQEVARHSAILEQAIEVLLTYRLIEHQAAAHTLSIAAPLQATLRNHLSLAEQQSLVEQILRACYLLISPSTGVESARLWLCVPHVQQIATLSEEWVFTFPEAAAVFSWVAKVLGEQERYAEAEPLLNRVLTIYKHLYGDEHPAVAATLSDLANLQKMSKNYAEAERLFLRTNLVSLRALGPEHPDTILSLIGLGDMYAAQGKIRAAEAIYQRALTNSESVLGVEHPVTVAVRASLAALYLEWANAAEMGQDPQWGNKVETEEDEEEEEEEEEEEDESEEEGKEDPNEPPPLKAARVLHKLAFLYVKEQQWGRAEEQYRHISLVYEDVLGSAHPDTIQSLHELAYLYIQQGKLEEAEVIEVRLVETRERAVGPEHLDVAAELNSLAIIYIERKKFEQAEQVLQRALAIGADMPGAHPLIAMSLSNLAAVYLGQEKPQQATPLLRSVLVILEQALGPEHPEVVAVREQYKQVLKALQA